jgi:hypothetical protein
MKRTFLIAVVFCFSLFNLAAQQTQTASKDSIIFEKLVHDYGTIEQGADGGCEFVFTNKGEKPLLLTNVRASCGCTAPTWPREPILPGETGVIKVGYNTNIVGVFSKVISVNSNAANSMVTLTVKGTVLQKQ